MFQIVKRKKILSFNKCLNIHLTHNLYNSKLYTYYPLNMQQLGIILLTGNKVAVKLQNIKLI